MSDTHKENIYVKVPPNNPDAEKIINEMLSDTDKDGIPDAVDDPSKDFVNTTSSYNKETGELKINTEYKNVFKPFPILVSFLPYAIAFIIIGLGFALIDAIGNVFN